MKIAACILGALLWASWALPAGAQAPKESCVACHSSMGGKLAEPVKLFPSGIHSQVGLGCSDCHGGDPNNDSIGAMSPAKGFRGAPTRQQIPEFCGRCHSNATYMRHFNPKLRTDQLSEYFTSVHGKRLKQGDPNVATCVDCHGVHDILAVTDSRSPVYATNVPSTCAHCHSDAAKMKQYKIPTDEAAKYRKSVHYKTLLQGDLSAPTCSTCHGAHGATPPGVNSVPNVCGTCHVVFAQLFDKSPHKAAFAASGLPGCVVCHSNHEIVVPQDAWVGIGSKSVCTACHTEGDEGYKMAKAIGADLAALQSSITRADDTLGIAERSGMEVSAPELELTTARGDLIKARVAVHNFSAAPVKKITDQGIATATKSYQAGVAALHERDRRRKGLGLSLIFIVMAVGGLFLKIRHIESRHK